MQKDMNPQKPSIPFVDLFTPEIQSEVDTILAEFKTVVGKSEFILGEAVSKFEKAFAQIAGCEHGVGVNSGLDALILALRVLKVGPGDEVITAPNSFIASAAAIDLVGAKTVFVDIGDDYNLDPELLEAAITKKTKAIMPVHLTGNPCKMDKIAAIAKKHNLFIIEDAAQAIGASYAGKAVGAWSDIAAFSLHPLKNLHVWGDGGMMTMHSAEHAQALKLQRNHGLKNRDEVEFFSYNSRLDTLQAVVGLHSVRMIGKISESRVRHAEIYYSRLKELEEYITPPVFDRKLAKPVFHVYQTRATDRDALKEFLLGKGIDTKVHYPIPIHWQKGAAHLGYKKGDFPVCDKFAQEILSLPVRENLTDDQVHFICDQVKAFYK